MGEALLGWGFLRTNVILLLNLRACMGSHALDGCIHACGCSDAGTATVDLELLDQAAKLCGRFHQLL